MPGLSSIILLFGNEFNKFNNARARMLDNIYHMTLNVLLEIALFYDFAIYMQLFCFTLCY